MLCLHRVLRNVDLHQYLEESRAVILPPDRGPGCVRNPFRVFVAFVVALDHLAGGHVAAVALRAHAAAVSERL